MMELLNVPNRDLLELASRRKLFFDTDHSPRLTANSHGKLRTPGEWPETRSESGPDHMGGSNVAPGQCWCTGFPHTH